MTTPQDMIDAWTQILPESGIIAQAMIMGAHSIDLDEIDKALDGIRREESIGCLINPTPFVRDDAFRRLAETRDVLQSLRRFAADMQGFRRKAEERSGTEESP